MEIAALIILLLLDYQRNKEGRAKEGVKAVLSDNKLLISTAFAALIQTLKTDPEMVKLIYNILTANNGEQHKDDNNNITKYLELKKDSLLDLAEKIYENLVEALINNAVDNTSPNPTLSSSSSTFPSSFIKVISTEEKSQKSILIVEAILLIELVTAVVVVSLSVYHLMLQ
jgi:hypothetical protein